MAHVEKYTKADVTGIFIHYDRTPGHELSNKDIDSSKTHLNYNLADHDQPLKQKSFLSKRLKEVITNGRKNQNVACDWIITQPQDVKENDSRKFFEEVYDYLAGMYGRKNIISSYIHMDEIGKTPHMHFCFMPVQTLEDGTEKLNAKAVVGRNELNRFHPQLQKEIDKRMGYHVSIQSGITQAQGGNKTVRQLKSETAAAGQLPEGKKSLLGDHKTYTSSENELLQEKAKLGIAYETELKERPELQRQQAQKTYALNQREKELDQRTVKLDLLQRDLEQQKKRIELYSRQAEEEYRRKMAEADIAPERLTELENENRSLRETVESIFRYFGTKLMYSIPGMKERIVLAADYNEDPSMLFTQVIEKRFIAPIRRKLDELNERFLKLQNAVFSVFSSLHTLNNNDLGTKETASMESELNHDLESLYRKEELTDVYDAANQQKQDHFIHDLFE